MDVARARFDRFGKDVVHESYDGRLLRHRRVAVLVPIEVVVENFDVALLFYESVDCFRADAESRLDELREFVWRRDNGHGRLSYGDGDFVDGGEIERVACGDVKGAVRLNAEGKDVASVNDFDWKRVEDVFGEFRRSEVDDLDAKLFRDS